MNKEIYNNNHYQEVDDDIVFRNSSNNITEILRSGIDIERHKNLEDNQRNVKFIF